MVKVKTTGWQNCIRIGLSAAAWSSWLCR
jgi:hypothetical protein